MKPWWSLLVLLPLAWGCVQDFEVASSYKCGDAEDFKLVSPVLEKRCGTLDCHGHPARPLRLYGSRGLRLVPVEDLLDPNAPGDPDLVPGGVATTDEEYEANRRSVCGLEPELTTRVIDGLAEPLELLLLRKPLLIERHKGSQLFVPNSPTNNCIVGWLKGKLSSSECDAAAKEL